MTFGRKGTLLSSRALPGTLKPPRRLLLLGRHPVSQAILGEPEVHFGCDLGIAFQAHFLDLFRKGGAQGRPEGPVAQDASDDFLAIDF